MEDIHSEEAIFKLVSFEIGEELFALSIMEIQEIVRMPEVVPVPQAPTGVEGVINLRGHIIPVLNMRTRFGMAREGDSYADARVIIVERGAQLIGLMVDSVHEVLRVEQERYVHASALSVHFDQKQLKGIIKHEDKMFMVLDPVQLFSDEDVAVTREVA